MEYIKGDLIKFAITGNFEVIAHGCNCICTMGTGIAKTFREKIGLPKIGSGLAVLRLKYY